MPGNIFSKDSLDKVDEWLNGEKVDFIIERMQGGWVTANADHVVLYAKYLARWYERLSKEGSMMLQTLFGIGLPSEEGSAGCAQLSST